MKQCWHPIFDSLVAFFGMSPVKAILFAKGWPRYYRNLRMLESQRATAAVDFPFGKLYPCMEDRTQNSGSTQGHYFHQDLLVARRVYLNQPVTHVDIGSRVDGFVAHVASFRQIEVFDIRPLPNTIPNIRFRQADLMTPIAKDLENYCDSLSCLHALEHFGLGRYGDPINYDGYLLGLTHLWKILKPGGTFYLSVPIGPQRIEFDAHRIFSVAFLLRQFAGKYRVEHVSFVDDQGNLHEDVPVSDSEAQVSFGCTHGCGIFELTKL